MPDVLPDITTFVGSLCVKDIKYDVNKYILGCICAGYCTQIHIYHHFNIKTLEDVNLSYIKPA
jgi:hypothetical protein